MRCLLVADGDIALREASLLHRLVIGLLDSGVHVTHAAPESIIDRVERSLGVEILTYRERGFPWTRSIRANQLLEQFERATEVSAGDPGLVHAFGSDCIPLALDVARAGDLAVVIDVNSRAMVSQVIRQVSERFEGVLLAGSPAIARALRAGGIAASSVRECQWGVSLTVRSEQAQGGVRSIAIGGSGASRASWESCLRAVAQVSAVHDHLSIFVDADAAERARIGPLVGKLGLSPLISRIPDFESRRDLVVRADVLLWPERLGEVRSLVLDAIATATPVIAVSDPDIPHLSDPMCARLVSGEESEWTSAIEQIVTVEDHRAVASKAAATIRETHSATSHIGAVVDAYEWASATSASRERL